MGATWSVPADAASVGLDRLLGQLATTADGLTPSEAEDRLRAVGANELTPLHRHNSARLLLHQYTSPLTLVLLAATVLSSVVGDITDGLIILAIILPTGLLGFWQEHSAGRLMVELTQRLQPATDVVRDGRTVTVPARELVPGDMLELTVGAVIGADARVMQAAGLEVDESTLTGESFGVPKSAGTDVVRMGTHVTAGAGVAVVYATGRSTEYGSMAADLEAPATATSFERGSTEFGLLVVRSIAVLLAGVFVINVALHRPVTEALLFSLALAVGLTPQLLPVIVTVTLASGARRLAASAVLVKRLDAIEDFGSMTVLCCDKTGTLTVGTVSVDRAVDPRGQDSEHVLHLARVNAVLQTGYPNAIDDALRAARQQPVGAALLAEAPYDFQRRRLTVLARLDGATENVLVTKGAVRSVLEVCVGLRRDGGVVPIAEVRAGVLTQVEALSVRGLRVLGVATRATAQEAAAATDEHDLIFEGLVAFADPVKSDARQALADLRAAGIQPVLVTGDNPLVARSVAQVTGFEVSRVVTGGELSDMPETELLDAVKEVRVFAEIEPLQKERIVRALQSAGHSVGLLGDGVNDSAALRAADVGISVDTAAPVAKETAAIVLLRKDLSVISEGVRIGRHTFANTMKYIRITISANFGNVLSMALASAFLPYLPLLAAQVLLLNFMSDIPALTVASDRVDDEDVVVARRWDLADTRRFMVVFGLVSTVFDLTAFAVLHTVLRANEATFHSAWFIESTLTEIVALLALRTTRPWWRSRPSIWMALASFAVAAVTIALPYSFAAGALGLVPLPASVLAVMVGITAVYIAANEVAKAARRRSHPASLRSA